MTSFSEKFLLLFSLTFFTLFFIFYYRYQHSHQTIIEIPESILIERDIYQEEVLLEQQAHNLPSSHPDLHNLPSEFLPGTLNISGEETLRMCYLEPDQSDQHRGKSQCVISDEHKIIFFLVPKTGSSTNRIAFREILNGTGGNVFCTQKITPERRAYRTVVTVREPLGRFFSQYMEAEFRAARADKAKMKDNFDWWKLDPIPRFLKFVDYWHKESMREVLDTHFRLQAPMLSWYDGSVRRIDWFMPIETIDDAWKELKDILNVVDNRKKTQTARKNYHPSINKTLIEGSVKRKICQIVATDYCCLNYKLPEVCAGTVACEYKKRLNTESAARYITAKRLSL